MTAAVSSVASSRVASSRDRASSPLWFVLGLMFGLLTCGVALMVVQL